MTRRFRPNHSIILGIILWGVVLVSFFFMDLPGVLYSNHVGLIFPVLILLSISTLWFGVQYIVVDDQFRIKIGPFTTFNVEIASIESVNRSFNALSSPAPSLKRLEVKLLDGSFVLISPFHERDFIRTLKEINPAIYNGIRLSDENNSMFLRIFYWLL